MKNSIKLLTNAGALMLLTVSLTTNAQQLPNFGFNDWKGTCGSSEAFGTGGLTSSATGDMRQRPGDEPTGWNGSSVNQKVMMEKKETLVFKDGDETNYFVKLQNKFVGVSTIGSVAPGYITFGTPWVYAVSTISQCDGGTYGGLAFNGYKPEKLRLKVKRTDTNNEDSYVIAYLWNGTFKSKVGKLGAPTQERDNCDRAILGYAPDAVTGDGVLVASLEKTFSQTANSDWEVLEIPFQYFDNDKNAVDFDQADYTQNVTAPAMINVVICSGNYKDRSKLVKETTLYVDDVELVYPTKEYTGKTMTVGLTADENAAAPAEWTDAKLSVEDYGNMVSTDGYKTSTGKVTLGDVTLDGVKLTHNDDNLCLSYADDTYALDGSLNDNGTYLVHIDKPTTNERVKFADTKSATTGIEAIDGIVGAPVVFGGQGYVNVAGVTGTVSLYTLTGVKVAEVHVDGEATIPATPGITIVATPAGAFKCTVK